MAEMRPAPSRMRRMRSSLVMSRTSASKISPSVYTVVQRSAYENGRMLRRSSRTASDAPTRLPAVIRCTREIISICPRLILVGIDRAWKKPVCPGSQPVGPGSTYTLIGAMAPTRAGAGTTTPSTVSRILATSPFVNTKPTLPSTYGSRFLIGCDGFSSRKSENTRRIVVFLPMIISASPRSAARTCCIWWEPTLLAFTSRMFLLFRTSDTSRFP
mmetsp:Transcript_92551/g.138693  ORF Transcript_92551/g.138693 Transcript_92551/m.138693 type:complete len:215 (-) Transcript_92551:73-717(-)